MLQPHGTYVFDIGPQKLCYDTLISPVLLDICKVSGIKGIAIALCLFVRNQHPEFQTAVSLQRASGERDRLS